MAAALAGNQDVN